MAPVLVALLLFIVGAGRLVEATGEVDGAARDAARAAANARSTTAARTAAIDAATQTLADRGVACRSLKVSVDTTGFRADGIARATVTCTVDLKATTSVGFPVARTVSSTFAAPVDRYRGVRS
jgi:Flp pilus assembly protein TadG